MDFYGTKTLPQDTPKVGPRWRSILKLKSTWYWPKRIEDQPVQILELRSFESRLLQSTSWGKNYHQARQAHIGAQALNISFLMDTRPSVKPMLSWKGRCKSNSWPRDLSTNLAHRFGGWLTVEMHLRRGKSFVPTTLMGKVVFISEWQWQNTMSCVSIEAKSESRSQIGFVRKACRDVHPKLVSLFLGQLTVVLPVEKHIFLNTFFLRVDFTLNLLDGSPAKAPHGKTPRRPVNPSHQRFIPPLIPRSTNCPALATLPVTNKSTWRALGSWI